ncbi:MAG: lysophospholipid acyltransferase family protein [Chthoniobacterales bacterium]
MSLPASSSLRRFATRGIFWREYLDWAVRNVPFYLQPILIFCMSAFFFFFAGSVRRAAVANLSLALPGSSSWMNHLRAFRTLLNFAWTIRDAAHFRFAKNEFAYEIEGAEYLDQLAVARGAIVLTAHMGSYDLGAAIFAQKFQREIRMVRAPEADADTARHVQTSLGETGDGAVKVSYSTSGALLSFDLLSAVRDGEIVSIQGDRVIPGVASAEMELFGERVPLPTGPFTLALVAQVPIYPLFFVRAGYRRYRIVTRAPIWLRRTERTRDEDVATGMATWCDVLEATITEYWHQWFALVPILPAHAKR